MSGRPAGLDQDYFTRLIDEMDAQGMNLLSIMMQSYGFYDPAHDGYCWPVRNPSLAPYIDKAVLNTEHEFLKSVIKYASEKRIEVELFLNWGIWNPEIIAKNYANAYLQVDRRGRSDGWLHCPDAPGAWQAGLDEVKDLLTYYGSTGISKFAFERVSYASASKCFCNHTRASFYDEKGYAMDAARKEDIITWKQEHISRLLADYVRHVKGLKPGLLVGLHTQGKEAWGHDPSKFKAAGIDYVEPHTVQFKTSRHELFKMLRHLHPNDCVLHFCTRDIAPANYPIWKKTPRIIKRVLNWVTSYPGENVTGVLFFNEPATSVANKATAYQFATACRRG